MLDFFSDGPIGLTLPGGDLDVSSTVDVKLWSVARRSRASTKGAAEQRIEELVGRRNDGTPRFFHDAETKPDPAWRSVVRDPDVDVVVELTGSPVAEAIIEEALWNGKCVVTANKAVVSRSGHDLVRLARSRGVILAYEAAVGGGMPIVQTAAGSIGGRVQAILAILNGTTNFILSRMFEGVLSGRGGSYQQAVCAAIHGGLAEADPGADVLGEDSRSKIMILAGLAFGVRLRPQDVYVKGIARRGPAEATTLKRRDLHDCPGGVSPCDGACLNDDHLGTRPIFTSHDLVTLNAMGFTPKMLSGAQRSGDRIVAWAQPAVLPSSHALGGVDGADNGCVLEVESPGQSAGTLFAVALRGPGAGGPETASSVMADVLFCARQLGSGARSGGASSRYMYGADAFRTPQAMQGAPSLLQLEQLKASFVLRFIIGSDTTAGEVADSLASAGLDVTIYPSPDVPTTHVYLRTGPQSMRSVEGAIRKMLRTVGVHGASLDVLYLPIFEGIRWVES